MTDFRLYAVRVFSFEWEESLEFYRDKVGFAVAFSDAEMGWAQFQLGESYIGLERCDPNDEESKDLVGRFVGTSIEVDNIHSVYDSLMQKGVVFTSAPQKQPWGGVLAHFKDPDSNIITLLGGDA
ncbi:MAG: VOC family protein [Pseudomonadales bacterium]|nr:VOC family protein [Pseudomonadales bacterium]